MTATPEYLRSRVVEWLREGKTIQFCATTLGGKYSMMATRVRRIAIAEGIKWGNDCVPTTWDVIFAWAAEHQIGFAHNRRGALGVINRARAVAGETLFSVIPGQGLKRPPRIRNRRKFHEPKPPKVVKAARVVKFRQAKPIKPPKIAAPKPVKATLPPAASSQSPPAPPPRHEPTPHTERPAGWGDIDRFCRAHGLQPFDGHLASANALRARMKLPPFKLLRGRLLGIRW